MERYSGRVLRKIFHSGSKNFYILSILLDRNDLVDPIFQGDIITVKGTIVGIDVSPNTWLSFEGKWVHDKKYGRQFSIVKCPAFNDEFTIEEISGILSNITGISSMFAQRICANKTPSEVLLLLGDSKALVKSNPSLNAVTASNIVTSFQERLELLDTLNSYSDLNIPSHLISKLRETYGRDAYKMLTTNPWIASVDGVLPFSLCDSIAINRGLPLDSDIRLDSCILKTCMQNNFGHLFMKSGDIYKEVSKSFSNLDVKRFASRLKEMHVKGKIVIDKNTTPVGGGKVTAIYSKRSYQHEEKCASLLSMRIKNTMTFSQLMEFGKIAPIVEEFIISLDLSREAYSQMTIEEQIGIQKQVGEVVVDNWSKTAKIHLSELQRQGVVNGLIQPVSIITGLPGTGKTTSLRALVSIFIQMGITPSLGAPTGIASKRLEFVTGSKAYTIHKTFGSKLDKQDEDREKATYEGVVKSGSVKGAFDEDSTMWEFDEENPHPAKVLIIDESSMVDQALLYRILTATSDKCKVIFVGDSAQLPSVGPGDVLKCLVDSGCFATVALTEIFRQASQSDIIVASHNIHKGIIPDTNNLKDFTLDLCMNENDLLEKIIDVSCESYAKKVNFQILSPRHKGTVGVTNLNKRIREVINPKMAGVTQVKIGDTYIREGDRVMIIKNDYDIGIFNGDVGKVSFIDQGGKKISVKVYSYGDEPANLINIPIEEAGIYLRLAYAVTVHKSQGLEYDYIFMPITDSFSIQLVRNLLYTAVTRAKKKVILFGTRTALTKAVLNDTLDSRNTLFTERIISHIVPF